MRLRSLRERELVSAIRKEFAGAVDGLLVGIGDDAAVIRGAGARCLLTTDLLIEDVHFISALHPPVLLGRKALNVNLSDIAAMGGRPRYALLGLALRPDIGKRWVGDFFAGFKDAAAEAGVGLAGGDVSAANKICLSVTVVGEVDSEIRRNGARPGDFIYVSGSLGDSAAGLRLLKAGHKLGKNKKTDALLQAFLDPAPQIGLGLALAGRRLATAMIDTSDGLSVDLGHLCEESGTGALVELAALPLSPGLRRFEKDCIELALHGGEDYQLLFTVSPRKSSGLAALRKEFEVHRIGRMTAGKSIQAVDEKGRKRPLSIKGYEHLR
jgi:thiamine-monophosphate kinase